MPFLNDLHADFKEGDDNITLLEPLEYYDNRSKQLFSIFKGFTCDGLSIPSFLWPILGHPFESNVVRAAILHDFLYRNAVVERKIADQMCYDALIEEDCNSAKAQIIYAGIRIYASEIYKDYKKERRGQK